jgi:hypothetical protein
LQANTQTSKQTNKQITDKVPTTPTASFQTGTSHSLMPYQ